jgi:hypothetical protein
MTQRFDVFVMIECVTKERYTTFAPCSDPTRVNAAGVHVLRGIPRIAP